MLRASIAPEVAGDLAATAHQEQGRDAADAETR